MIEIKKICHDRPKYPSKEESQNDESLLKITPDRWKQNLIIVSAKSILVCSGLSGCKNSTPEPSIAPTPTPPPPAGGTPGYSYTSELQNSRFIAQNIVNLYYENKIEISDIDKNLDKEKLRKIQIIDFINWLKAEYII